MPEFMECSACAAKPGSPTLCASCLHNRRVICELTRERDQLVRAFKAHVSMAIIHRLFRRRFTLETWPLFTVWCSENALGEWNWYMAWSWRGRQMQRELLFLERWDRRFSP